MITLPSAIFALSRCQTFGIVLAQKIPFLTEFADGARNKIITTALKGAAMQTIKCLDCHLPFSQPDDCAVHMLERHGWDYERARLWLRDMVEGVRHPMVSCPCPECEWAEKELVNDRR
jgi:hypothetical protein